MKKSLILLTIFLLIGTALFAQKVVFQQSFSGAIPLPRSQGEWAVKGGRLYQADTEEKLAKINVMAAQSGEMQYEFDLRYEGGGMEDLMGGFGIQVFVDKAHDGKSWGNGNSFLLWLNYDPDPSYGAKGFQGQVYKSTSHTKMTLVGQFDLNAYVGLLNAKNMSMVIKGRIKVDGDTGAVWVEDPTLPGYGYAFSLGGRVGMGSYMSLRTNSLALSFDNLKVSKLD